MTEDSHAPSVLRGGFILLLGRHTGALALTGAVVVLTGLVPRREYDGFIWAYAAELLVSSLLNFGFERLTANRVGITQDLAEVPAILSGRLLTIPFVLLTITGLLAFVDVHLTVVAIGMTVLWTVSVQIQGVLFAALRGLGKPGKEARLAPAMRFCQAALLVATATRTDSVAALIASVALPEVVIALFLLARWPTGFRLRSPMRLPMRTLGLYTLIEVLAFAYLRADVLVVGRVLGPSPGAIYVLAYRVLDGLTGVFTPFLHYLFPLASRRALAPGGLRLMRRWLLGWAPALGTALAIVVFVASGLLPLATDRFGEARPVLEVLLVTLPLFAFSATELHLRSAEGRNRMPVALGACLLSLNVGLNVVLVPRFGVVAAAWVLVACELVQAIFLGASLGRARDQRAPLLRSALGAILLGLAVAASAAWDLRTALALLAASGVVVGWSAVGLLREGSGYETEVSHQGSL